MKKHGSHYPGSKSGSDGHAHRLPAELFTHLRSAALHARVVHILVNTDASSIEAGVVSANAHSREALEEQSAIKPVANLPCRIPLGPLERLWCAMKMPRPAPILRVCDDGPNFHERRVTRWPEDLQAGLCVAGSKLRCVGSDEALDVHRDGEIRRGSSRVAAIALIVEVGGPFTAVEEHLARPRLFERLQGCDHLIECRRRYCQRLAQPTPPRHEMLDDAIEARAEKARAHAGGPQHAAEEQFGHHYLRRPDITESQAARLQMCGR